MNSPPPDEPTREGAETPAPPSATTEGSRADDQGPASGDPQPAPPAPPARRDRWAHRRGEPRLFVLVWTLYLFCATLLALVAVSAAGSLTSDMYRPAARLLMVAVAAGVVIVWPMIRLSQVAPGRAGAILALQDYFVVMLPAQAVIWPQWSLARLPIEAIAALSANIAAWGVITGGLLAHALSTSPREGAGGLSGGARAAWMGVFSAIAVGGGVVALLGWAGAPGATVPACRPGWMWSPLTAIFEILADRSWMGTPAAVTRAHWLATGLTAVVGLGLWSLAGWRSSRGVVRARPVGLH